MAGLHAERRPPTSPGRKRAQDLTEEKDISLAQRMADELWSGAVQPGFPGAPARTLWDSPVTPRENLLAALATKECLFLPNVLDMRSINPVFLADNRARGTVMDGGEPFVPDPAGEKDVFGVAWVYDAAINGSTVRPGSPLLDQVEGWEDRIVFPRPDEWDWAGQAQRSRDYLSDALFVRKSTIFTGFFERLVSFMDFENAACDREFVVKELYAYRSPYLKTMDRMGCNAFTMPCPDTCSSTPAA